MFAHGSSQRHMQCGQQPAYFGRDCKFVLSLSFRSISRTIQFGRNSGNLLVTTSSTKIVSKFTLYRDCCVAISFAILFLVFWGVMGFVVSWLKIVEFRKTDFVGFFLRGWKVGVSNTGCSCSRSNPMLSRLYEQERTQTLSSNHRKKPKHTSPLLLPLPPHLTQVYTPFRTQSSPPPIHKTHILLI